MNKLHSIKCHKVSNVRKKNLNELLDNLSVAIDTKDKSLLVYLTNRWKCYQVNIFIENDINYIINNSNQINYINYIIEDAKYLISHNKE